MTLPDETIGENTAVIILGEVAEQAAVNQIPTDGGGQVLQKAVLVFPAEVEVGFIMEGDILLTKQLMTGSQGRVGSGADNGVGVVQLVIQINTGRDDVIPSHQGVGCHDAAAGVIGGIAGVKVAGPWADSRHGRYRCRSNNLDGGSRKSGAGKGCHSRCNTDDVLGLHDYYLVRVLIVDLLTKV